MSDFERVHDRYLQAWADAMATGDAVAVEAFLAPGYHGWFAPTSDRHVPYDRADAVAGMRESVAKLRGAGFRAEHRTVYQRGHDEAVVSYEKLIGTADDPAATAFIVEAWRREGERWLLCRELTEHGRRLGQLERTAHAARVRPTAARSAVSSQAPRRPPVLLGLRKPRRAARTSSPFLAARRASARARSSCMRERARTMEAVGCSLTYHIWASGSGCFVPAPSRLPVRRSPDIGHSPYRAAEGHLTELCPALSLTAHRAPHRRQRNEVGKWDTPSKGAAPCYRVGPWLCPPPGLAAC